MYVTNEKIFFGRMILILTIQFQMSPGTYNSFFSIAEQPL